MHKMRIAALAGLCAVAAIGAGLLGSARAFAADSSDAQARAAWRETISHAPVPEAGCFQASYPSTRWQKVECTVAPNIPYIPRSGSAGKFTVGDGADYAAQVPDLLTSSVGTFPVVTGVKTELDGIRPNVYSLQLNSNFMTTAACDGIPGCLSWEQFVYSSSERSAFMQYWLINYGKTCPSGWNSYSQDCYVNSAAVSVPKIAISELATMKLAGSAVQYGIDTLTFTADSQAYVTTGNDSMVDLATGWNQSEFNIVGDGGGSQANFNKGSSITVGIAVTDPAHQVPSCASNAGTTGETNNLKLGSCTSSGGDSPSIQFTESN